MRWPQPPSRERGVGLIELMVSIILALLVIGGVLSLYLGNRWNYRTHQQLGRIQENARFAFELMMRETRDAGLMPCGSTITANVIRNVGNPIFWWADTGAGMVRAYDGAQAAPAIATGARTSGTDALLLMRPASTERDYGRITAHDPATKTFTLAGAITGLQANDVVLVCDPQSSALLQLASAGSTPRYNNAPLNCTDQLGTLNTDCDITTPKTFAIGGLMVPWQPAIWYVGPNSRGSTSLYRISISNGAEAPATEMIPSVSDFQVDFLRQSGTSIEDKWVTPTQIGTSWNSATTPIVAVRARITLAAEGATNADNLPLTRTLVAVATLRNVAP